MYCPELGTSTHGSVTDGSSALHMAMPPIAAVPAHQLQPTAASQAASVGLSAQVDVPNSVIAAAGHASGSATGVGRGVGDGSGDSASRPEVRQPSGLYRTEV